MYRGFPLPFMGRLTFSFETGINQKGASGPSPAGKCTVIPRASDFSFFLPTYRRLPEVLPGEHFPYLFPSLSFQPAIIPVFPSLHPKVGAFLFLVVPFLPITRPLPLEIYFPYSLSLCLNRVSDTQRF